jgi:uncharacterized protein YjbI with pentapeptide repeats
LAQRIRLTQQQILVIAKRHELLFGGKSGGARAKFSFMDLSGLDFSNLNLSNADFTGALLRETNFSHATLKNTIFFAADLTYANFERADLSRADLRGACLRSAVMTGATLVDADLREGSLATADITHGIKGFQHNTKPTEMNSASLVRADLTKAKMSGLTAMKADFTDAVLRSCNLSRANLKNANFVNADLGEANLNGADLRGANMAGAVLIGAKMTGVSFGHGDMAGALTDAPIGRSLNDLDRPLEGILADHLEFVDSNGQQGQAASLEKFDLRSLGNFFAGKVLTALNAKGAIMFGLDLTGAKLQGADLEGADLRSACLADCDLRGANLTNARLRNSDLRNANLSPIVLGHDRRMATRLIGADLRQANASGANLSFSIGTNLDASYANLTHVKFNDAQFDGAVFLGARVDMGLLKDAKIDAAADLRIRGAPKLQHDSPEVQAVNPNIDPSTNPTTAAG